jgi:hypothetical protein
MGLIELLSAQQDHALVVEGLGNRSKVACAQGLAQINSGDLSPDFWRELVHPNSRLTHLRASPDLRPSLGTGRRKSSPCKNVIEPPGMASLCLCFMRSA